MKTYLVVNPHSANGQTGRRWAEISARVTRALGEVSVGFTRSALDATRLTREALRQGYELVVAVGGDGTINEVTNGFFEGDGSVVRDGAALGVLPLGTGGDFRRTFGWDLHLETNIARLKGEGTQPFDVGRVEYATAEGAREWRYFANIASCGVSGDISQVVNATSKALGGRLSFVWGTVKGLTRYTNRPVRFRLDGGEWQGGNVTCLAVANGRYFGSGMCVAPNASTSDGLFDVTVWSDYTLKDFIFKSPSIYNGDHLKWDRTRALRGRTVEVESDFPLLLEVDGEVPGQLPARFDLLPGVLRLKV